MIRKSPQSPATSPMQMLKRYTHLRAEDLVERLDQVMG